MTSVPGVDSEVKAQDEKVVSCDYVSVEIDDGRDLSMKFNGIGGFPHRAASTDSVALWSVVRGGDNSPSVEAIRA